MFRPSNPMVPLVTSSAARTSFAVVVLPQPDSPTRPRVSPRLTVKLMPSTALTQPRPPPSSDLPAAKCFVRSRTSSNGSLTRGLVNPKPAPDGGPIAALIVPGLVSPTALHHVRAARVEAAAGRQVGKIRRLAGDAVQRLPGAQLRDGVQQCLGVGVLGAVEQTPDRLHLHDLARI